MSKIQIICTNPGMRRHGIVHPQSATYEPGHWTADQLAAFRDDPLFIVQEIDDDAVINRGPEFDQAVSAEVERRLTEKVRELQASFASAVNDAAAEKVKLAVDEVNAMTKGQIEAAVNIAVDETVATLGLRIKALEAENAELKVPKPTSKAK